MLCQATEQLRRFLEKNGSQQNCITARILAKHLLPSSLASEIELKTALNAKRPVRKRRLHQAVSHMDSNMQSIPHIAAALKCLNA